MRATHTLGGLGEAMTHLVLHAVFAHAGDNQTHGYCLSFICTQSGSKPLREILHDQATVGALIHMPACHLCVSAPLLMPLASVGVLLPLRSPILGSLAAAHVLLTPHAGARSALHALFHVCSCSRVCALCPAQTATRVPVMGSGELGLDLHSAALGHSSARQHW